MSPFLIKRALLQCETAMIEAVKAKREFTICGYFAGKFHVPSLGIIH